MKIYHYHPETKEYLGESNASLDPMATKRAGQDVFLLPAYAIFDPPPEFTKGSIAIFENKEWVVVDDKRGETYYAKETGHPVVIKAIGEEKDFVSFPPPDNESKWIDGQWAADQDKLSAKIMAEEKARSIAEVKAEIGLLKSNVSKASDIEMLKKIVSDLIKQIEIFIG